VNIYQWFKSQHFGRGSISTRYALIEACVIGVFSALAALLLKLGIGWLGGYRLKLAELGGASFVLPLWGVGLGMIAGWMVEQFSPAAGGGGIPQIKAALVNFPVPLNLRVALVKIIGTILVLGAGLTLGRRSPTVHIGAALAGELTRWIPTSPEHRRQMLAAGAAAGLASGFNTPIAGVLFVVEELMGDISGLTLEIAIIASFTGAVVSLWLQHASLQLPQTLLQLGDIKFTAEEIPFYLILGAIAGVLGALFNRGVIFNIRFNRSLQIPLSLRIGIAGLISGLIIAQLPPFFRDYTGLKEFLISGEFGWRTTALALIAHFLLSIIAAGSGAPGGLFAPALIMGSALGYLMGDFAELLTGVDSASTYALAGMGAFFTAVVRVPITAIVMIFELNANFNLVLPLMITCVVAYFTAETFHRGSLDQHLLKLMGVDLNEGINQQANFLTDLKANNVMQSQVETVSSQLLVKEFLVMMSVSHHRGFPVVDDGKLVGIVTQSDLDKIKNERSWILIEDIMTKKPITVEVDASLSDVIYLFNRYKLSRLPVVDGNKLVGIITRTDIIRAEVDKLTPDQSSPPQQSYICYQTRTPEIGKGRILIPITPNDDYHALFTIGSAMARDYDYELEFIQVIKVNKHHEPRFAKVNTKFARHLMQRLERMGRKAKISTHTSIVVTHNRTDAILEVIQKRHINLLLISWIQKNQTEEVIFSRVIDNLIQKAPCELILVKLNPNYNSYPYTNNLPLGSCLVPMAGGPNAQEGLKLLPALLGVYTEPNLPSICLTKVHSPTDTELDCSGLDTAVEQLQPLVKTTVSSLCIRSQSVINAIVHLAEAEKCELVILGASRDSLLKQAFQGNIPEAIASQLNTTIIIVRLP
jgi:CIC family chloride channel protein